MKLASFAPKKQRVLFALGVMLMVLWAVTWARSIHRNKFSGGSKTEVSAFNYLGCDFEIPFCACRTVVDGGNPYDGFIKGEWPIPIKIDHPPAVLVLFSWCTLLPWQAALITWLCVQ